MLIPDFTVVYSTLIRPWGRAAEPHSTRFLFREISFAYAAGAVRLPPFDRYGNRDGGAPGSPRRPSRDGARTSSQRSRFERPATGRLCAGRANRQRVRRRSRLYPRPGERRDGSGGPGCLGAGAGFGPSGARTGARSKCLGPCGVGFTPLSRRPGYRTNPDAADTAWRADQSRYSTRLRPRRKPGAGACELGFDARRFRLHWRGHPVRS